MRSSTQSKIQFRAATRSRSRGSVRFQPTLRKARTGIDPRTREPVQIPERKAVKFTVGSKFKAQVQGS